METSNLCFLLLLLLLLSAAEGSRERVHKILHHQPDVTPVCRNESSNFILLTVCKIPSEGGVCHLTYRPERRTDPECGSKFRMRVENQTVFLQLSSLGAGDSGNISCECSRVEGTSTVELNITVVATGNRTVDLVLTPSNNKENPYRWLVLIRVLVLILVLVLMLAAGVVLGGFCGCLSHRRGNICLRLRLQRLASRRRQSPDSGPPQTLVEDVEPYGVFLQAENVLYEPCRAHSCSTISRVLT